MATRHPTVPLNVEQDHATHGAGILGPGGPKPRQALPFPLAIGAKIAVPATMSAKLCALSVLSGDGPGDWASAGTPSYKVCSHQMKMIDEVDVQLLKLLQADGRTTNADLAKSVGLSPPSVLQRVRALERAGLIKGYAAVLDAEKLGMRITAFAAISLSLHQDMPIERFRRAVQDVDEILECYHISGEYDFLLKILVRDMRAYETLIREKISKIRGIRQINSSFVFGATKQTTAIPL